MKTQTTRRVGTLLVLGALATLANVAQAGSDHHGEYDYAKVLSAQPIYTVERRPIDERECWNETVSYTGHQGSMTGVIAGGIIGGVIGNQIGKGHGRQAATVAGTLLGGSIGHDISHSKPRRHQAVEEHCRVYRRYTEEERITGYRVTYRYDGRTYTRTMSHDPGPRLRVRVKVEPAY